MDNEAVLAEFRAADALLEGHFKLSSGLHSSHYLQCARVLMLPSRAEKLCHNFASKLREKISEPVDLVISPAMGGVIVGYEVARQLACPSVFMERVEGQFELRRGFGFQKGARILMMEDVITTGLSSRECIAAIEALGGNVVAAGALIDRSGGRVIFDRIPLVALATIDAPLYDSAHLPPDLQKLPWVKPGSRGLKS